ncbi:MAG: phosphatidate cytidylyltransferase [Ruminiclostridium sp.]|nr:phosphatidate cytidylyltransferase [Ruminiclostridium sp.]
MLIDVLIGFGMLVGYYLCMIIIIISLKKILKLKSELVRKSFHMVCVMSVPLMLYTIKTWYKVLLISLVFIIIVYPALSLIEHYPTYTKFFSERNKGEVKRSLILVYVMISSLTFIFWGLFGEEWKFVIVTSVMAWGFGDAAAALIGKAYGRLFVKHRMVENKKTWEGTSAMFTASFLAVFITTMLYGIMPWYMCGVLALLVSPLCAIIELISHKGMDTITVPFAAAFSILLFVSFFRFVGV